MAELCCAKCARIFDDSLRRCPECGASVDNLPNGPDVVRARNVMPKLFGVIGVIALVLVGAYGLVSVVHHLAK
jgi:hypothetical protein